MLATAESKNQAVSKLESLIERGRSRAANVIDHVMRNQPTDRLVRGDALEFRAADNLPEILITLPDREQEKVDQTLHRNAIYQMAQTTDMPVKFLDSLQAVAEPWGRELLAHNLQTVFNRRFQNKRYLLRSLQQEVRGFLSDSYRRIDSRPVVEAFATAVQEKGALPYEGYVTDTKIAFQAIMPEVYEQFPVKWSPTGCRWRTRISGTARCRSVRTCFVSGVQAWRSPRRRCGRCTWASDWTSP